MKAKEIKQRLKKDSLAVKGKKLVSGMAVCLVMMRLLLCLFILVMALMSHTYSDLRLNLIALIGLTVLCFFCARKRIKPILYVILGGGILGFFKVLLDLRISETFDVIRGFCEQMTPSAAKVVYLFFCLYWGLCLLNQIALIVCPTILLSARSSKRFFQICRGNKKMPDDAFCSE